MKAKTITTTNIPTARLFKRKGFEWNPFKGCANLKCSLHPKHKGKCWAANMCNRFKGIWAENEVEYLGRQSWMSLNDRTLFSYRKEEFITDYKSKLKEFCPVFLEAEFKKKFPIKQSCILVGWMGDIGYIDDKWVRQILEKIHYDNAQRKAKKLPLHVFQFLTKSPDFYSKWAGRFPSNCWLGVTGMNQKMIDDNLLNISNPKNLRYVYLKPLESEINLKDHLGLWSHDGKVWGMETGSDIDWVIVGGGDKPVNPECVRLIRDQCAAAKIPFFFKGWGKFCPSNQILVGDSHKFIIGSWSSPYWFYQDTYFKIKKNSVNFLDREKYEQFPEVKK